MENQLCLSKFLGISNKSTSFNKFIINIINEYSEFVVCYDCDLISYNTLSSCGKHYVCGIYDRFGDIQVHKDCDTSRIYICNNKCGFAMCDCLLFPSNTVDDFFVHCADCNQRYCNLCGGHCMKCDKKYCCGCYEKRGLTVSKTFEMVGHGYKFIFMDICKFCS